MKSIHGAYRWLLVVSGQKEGSRLCVRDEGLVRLAVPCGLGGMTDKFEKRVWVAWALFWSELAFLLEGLDVELFVRG